ncbi:hypothetical protein LCY76_11445 [Fictibacillus sp. KIGAM418]|uniref:Uncharacterized protein n=1 Tax=Fictibacillus marinisediminis TaxID=2878389 RepID=A0A9X1XAR3_9BACL|nr:hypothetical protein [Fictibacillus marinisediminis]MCK6257209.1 hypothetical protein [Fictibacillus marinisediminis]
MKNLYNKRKNNGSLRYFPYGGYDPFHKESVSNHPELMEHSPPRPPLPASPPSGSQHYASKPNPYMAAYPPYPPPPNPYMNHHMLPPRPPYPYNPFLGGPGGNGKLNKQNNNQAANSMFPTPFPFGNGGFPGGQQFPFNQQPFQNPGNQGSPFSWGKTFNGINSAMGMMQQLGSIISIFK